MFTIGKLAKRARLKADSIRFYERQGLIAPASRTGSGYRLYTDTAVRRLAFIKHAQRCGLSLTEIATLLGLADANSGDSAAAYRTASEKKRDIDTRISALQAMSDALASLLSASPAGAEVSSTNENPAIAALEASLSHRKRQGGAVKRWSEFA